MHTLTPTHRKSIVIEPVLSEETSNYHEYLTTSFIPIQSQILSAPSPHQLSRNQRNHFHWQKIGHHEQQPISRARLQKNNRKQRTIRSAHYRRNSQELTANKQTASQAHWNVKGETLSIKRVRSTSTRLVHSAHGSRSEGNFQDKNNYLASVGLDNKSRLQSPGTIISTRSIDHYAIRNKQPHVIYPFEAKLKIKRVDDNPRVLETIIAKKSKVMEREQLYRYVTRLATRRLQ